MACLFPQALRQTPVVLPFPSPLFLYGDSSLSYLFSQLLNFRLVSASACLESNLQT